MEDNNNQILQKHELTQTVIFNPLEREYTGLYNSKTLKIGSGKTLSVPTLVAKVVARQLARKCIEELDTDEINEIGQKMEIEMVSPSRNRKWLARIYKCDEQDIDENGNPPIFNDQSVENDVIVATEIKENGEVSLQDTTPVNPFEEYTLTQLKTLATSLNVVFDKKTTRNQLEKLINDKIKEQE